MCQASQQWLSHGLPQQTLPGPPAEMSMPPPHRDVSLCRPPPPLPPALAPGAHLLPCVSVSVKGALPCSDDPRDNALLVAAPVTPGCNTHLSLPGLTLTRNSPYTGRWSEVLTPRHEEYFTGWMSPLWRLR